MEWPTPNSTGREMGGVVIMTTIGNYGRDGRAARANRLCRRDRNARHACYAATHHPCAQIPVCGGPISGLNAQPTPTKKQMRRWQERHHAQRQRHGPWPRGAPYCAYGSGRPGTNYVCYRRTPHENLSCLATLRGRNTLSTLQG